MKKREMEEEEEREGGNSNSATQMGLISEHSENKRLRKNNKLPSLSH